MAVSPNRQSPSSNDHGLHAEILKNDLLLHEAVIKNDAEEVKKILQEPCDVNSRNNYGRAPIHWAACRGNTDLIKMLIDAKCDIEARDKYGMRPLLMAAWHGHLDAVKVLQAAGACSKSVNKQQHTLLMCASGSRRARPEVLDHVLISCGGARSLEMKDSDGRTALQHAAHAGHARLVKRLTRAGADLETIDNMSRTSLHLSCMQGHEEATDALLQAGARLDTRDEQGDSPLHAATHAQHVDVARSLVTEGAPVDAQNEKGHTPLHIASGLGCRGIIECLLEAGAAINKQAKNGDTPLHIACQTSNIDIIELFIAKGANLNLLNMRFESPMHVAAARGDAAACRALLAAGAGYGEESNAANGASGSIVGSPLLAAARGSFTAIVDMIIKTARLDYSPENEESGDKKGDVTIAKSAQCSTRQWKNSQETLGQVGGADQMKDVLWKLAYRQLTSGEWKKLAYHWSFTDEQIKAIEHQYTGPSSYKEHGFRMLLIWQHSLPAEVNTTKELGEGLTAIGKPGLADAVKKFHNDGANGKPSADCNCVNCNIT